MNRPFKIIFKYKNPNGSVQYNPYIFVGNIPPKINVILNKITKIPLITTLKTLSKSDIKELVLYYGEYWYKFFFIYNHLQHSISNISSSDRKVLQSKFGKEWISTHFNKSIIQKGGANDEEQEDNDEEQTDNDDEQQNEVPTNNDNIEDDGDLYEEEEQEKNEELEQEGETKDLKKKQKQNKVIESLIKKSNIKDKKSINNILAFDISKNSNFKSEELHEVFNKIYIKLYYIYDDDDILTVKKKICASIINDKAINKDAYLLPSRQYMFSQYIEFGKIKNYIIGHRFLKKDEIFQMIHPIPENNIDYYYNKNKKTEHIKDYISLNLIKLEDNNDIILNDLNQYLLNNEIFLLDIYHELYELKDYNEISEKQIQNLYDTYIKIYFPSIKKQDILQIINYMNNDKSTEYDIIKINYNKINLELFTYIKPFNIYSNTLYNYDTYKYIKNLYITLAIVKTYIHHKLIDLYVIFENFQPTKTIPFIRYHNTNHKNFVKIYTKITKEEKEYFLKWFENTPVGISMKIYLDKYNKYVTLKIYDTGRIEYTTQWKETDNITIQDIEKTYPIIINIIKNINKFSNRLKLKIPTVDDFNIEFVNAIQIFELPSNKTINYSIFKIFSQYFNPFVSYVSQDNDANKHGAHLIYKRISKYQQNVNKRIENNIVDILKNYEYTPENLLTHIITQLNISRDDAIKEIENVRSKYRFYKKKKIKKGKKMDSLPKYKQPGINVTIQGSHTNKQVIRISGCKNKFLLYKIIKFMSVFIFLFNEIVLLNKYPTIKNELESILKIASKLDNITVIKNTVNTRSNIKYLVDLDKDRFGFTPKKGKSNYSRMCLKEYQPLGFTTANLDKLQALGYVYDDKAGTYVYKSKTTKKRNNKFIDQVVTLSAIKLKNKSTGEDIYYACHPKFNKKGYQFISFQDTSKHPNKLCMPCCNKQDQLQSNKPNIRNRYLQCTSQISKATEIQEDNNILYISKDTNKLTHGRYGLLPDQLDLFLNNLTTRKLILKDIHFLDETIPSYFLKYGVHQNSDSFFNSIGICMNKSTNIIIKDIIDILKKDNKERLFISLYAGKIKLLFDNIDNYIKYIKTFEQVDYKYLIDIISNIYKINIFIFKRKQMFIDINDDMTKKIDEINLDCYSDYNTNHFYDKTRKNIILLYENNYFNPIFQVTKIKESKNLTNAFWFYYDDKNIINHILDYYNISCINKINTHDVQNKFNNISFNIYKELLSIKNKMFRPIGQILDNNYKSIGFILKNKFMLNIIPSTSIEDIPHILLEQKDRFIYTFQETYDFLILISKEINIKYDYNPINVLYSLEKKDKLYVKYIQCNNNIKFEIKPEFINKKNISKLKLNTKFFYTIDDMVNKEILKGATNILYDNRVSNINEQNYVNESYELLRLHISEFINSNKTIYSSINNILDKPLSFKEQHQQLYKIILSVIKQKFKVNSGKPSNNILKKYEIANKRTLCSTLNTKTCKENTHCSINKNKCSFELFENKQDFFINKLIDELINNPLKKSELLSVDDYYVSNIVDREIFTEREKQQIIREDVVSFEKSLYNIFGKDAEPIIGKKVNKLNINDSTYLQLNEQNKLKFLKTFFIQNIIENNNTLFRAYANGLFWIKNSYENIKYRNFGYFHPTQTDFSNYLRSIAVENLLKIDNIPQKKKIINKFINNIIKYSYNLYKYPKIYTISIPELLALQMHYNIPIYIYNHNIQILYILDNINIIYDYEKKNKVKSIYLDDKFKENSIHLKFTILPDTKLKIINIDVMYFISKK